MTALVPYRCEHTNGDVKYAVRAGDILVLEGKSYVCAVDPDEQFDEHETKFGPIEVYSGPTSTYTSSTVYDVSNLLPPADSPIIISGRTGTTPATIGIQLVITHTWVWDLVITLISPTNNQYILHEYMSNDGTENGGDANLNSSYVVTAVSEPINGTWILRVDDEANGDVGTLDFWSITL